LGTLRSTKMITETGKGITESIAASLLKGYIIVD